MLGVLKIILYICISELTKASKALLKRRIPSRKQKVQHFFVGKNGVFG